MNLEAAIREHTEWKVRLVLYINGSGRFDERSLGKAASCALGSWLKQSHARLFKYQEFQSVAQSHEKFHAIAEEVVQLVKQQRLHEARQLVSADGAFTKVAAELGRELLYLKRRMAKAA
jgi:hypothetical protein